MAKKKSCHSQKPSKWTHQVCIALKWLKQIGNYNLGHFLQHIELRQYPPRVGHVNNNNIVAKHKHNQR